MPKVAGLFALMLALGSFPMRAEACTLLGPSVEQTALEVAAKGVVVRGQIIQAFDPEKRQPEIVRVDEVFVGDARPGDFVIDHSAREYEGAIRDRRLEEEGKLICPGFGQPHYKLGQSFERLVLMPATTNGKWSFHFWGNNALMGAGLEMLLARAKELHRLNLRPPKSRQWGDCMECTSRGD
ncbi:MAG TPA: hypothetical protein VFH89_14115 [Sphingomicrobium sp.]|nr:hypothetical protein [Sphingomicrobium sp.]